MSKDGSVIVVSLDDPTEGMCVNGYLFELEQESRTSDITETFALFPMRNISGSTHLNQAVYTLDAEGRRGEVPCLFNITGKLFSAAKFCFNYSTNLSPLPGMYTV